MLNRKASKSANGAGHEGGGSERGVSGKAPKNRRRFIISPKAHGVMRSDQVRNGSSKAPAPSALVSKQPASHPPAVRTPAPDLAETIKTLVHLAHENGHV